MDPRTGNPQPCGHKTSAAHFPTLPCVRQHMVPQPVEHCDVPHAVALLMQHPQQSDTSGGSPSFWDGFWGFSVLRKTKQNPGTCGLWVDCCFAAACKLPGRHTLSHWSTDKLPRTSKGLLSQIAIDFCRNIMCSICLRSWRRAGVV